MTQQEIIKVLKKNKGKKLSVREISAIIKKSHTSIGENLKRMREFREVEFENAPIYVGNNARLTKKIYWLK